MPKRKQRVIVDTNLWISFLLTKNTLRLDRLFQNRSIVLLFSKELLDEFIDVAKRPKFRKYFSPADTEQLLTTLRKHAEFVIVTDTVTACRDPKDNFLLALAHDGKADYLVTGDKDLLDLKKFGKTKITTIVSFFEDMKNY